MRELNVRQYPALFLADLEGVIMKLGIVGAGTVGRACLVASVMRGMAREIVLMDRTEKKARGMVTDVTYGAVLSPSVSMRAGDYADLAGCALVMLTIGVNEKAGGATDRSDPEGRLKLLAKNKAIFQDVVPQIAKAAPDCILLVVTDPPDALADIARGAASGLNVVSTGTYLDSLRLRVHIGRKLEMHPGSVDAHVIGEHGTSEVFLWSSARVGGAPVLEMIGGREGAKGIEKEVREANIEIIEGTGASQLGIGMVCARIAEMVARDEHAVIPIGTYSEKYGVTLSLPSVVGRTGVVRVLTPEMTAEERRALDESAAHIRHALDHASG